MRSNTFELEADDGVQIHVHQWLPDDEPKAVLLIAHGVAEHGARYARFADAATSAGFAVYAEDHRGHGKTAKDEDDLAHFADNDGWSKMVDDLHRLLGHIGDEHPELKRTMFGHSMGSTLTQHLLFKYKPELAGVILSAPSLHPGLLGSVGVRLAKLERLRIGKRGKSKVLHDIAFGPFSKPFKPNRTDVDWLSRDPVEVDKYVDDPRCGMVMSAQSWIDHVPAIFDTFKLESQRKVDRETPMLIMAGSEDPVTDHGKSVKSLSENYRKAGVRRVDQKLYPGARHEPLNETNRDEVTDDILKWLGEAVG
jgi:alpha-beta hydrolase superfamily lysophospholipase